jgi:hypothetical protein
VTHGRDGEEGMSERQQARRRKKRAAKGANIEIKAILVQRTT